jgi:apolipoprotein N-acyltransferase
MKRFIIQSTLLAIFFLIAGYLLYTWVIPQWYTPLLIFMLLFIYATTNIVYAWLFRTLKKNNRKFTGSFMAVNFIKMFIYLLVVIGMAWMQREHAKVIMGNFLVMYISFSIMEVIAMVRLVKRNS